MEEGENLKENDEEFKKLIQLEDIENPDDERGEENEIKEDESEENENINICNLDDFEKILNIFFNKEIFAKYKFCHKCGNLMPSDNNKNYLDGKVWR